MWDWSSSPVAQRVLQFTSGGARTRNGHLSSFTVHPVKRHIIWHRVQWLQVKTKEKLSAKTTSVTFLRWLGAVLLSALWKDVPEHTNLRRAQSYRYSSIRWVWYFVSALMNSRMLFPLRTTSIDGCLEECVVKWLVKRSQNLIGTLQFRRVITEIIWLRCLRTNHLSSYFSLASKHLDI